MSYIRLAKMFNLIRENIFQIEKTKNPNDLKKIEKEISFYAHMFFRITYIIEYSQLEQLYIKNVCFLNIDQDFIKLLLKYLLVSDQ